MIFVFKRIPTVGGILKDIDFPSWNSKSVNYKPKSSLTHLVLQFAHWRYGL